MTMETYNLIDPATTDHCGEVKPDGVTIKVNATGEISTALKTVNGNSPDNTGNIELLTTQVYYGDGV